MPPAEQTLTTTSTAPRRELVRGWGRGEEASMLVVRPAALDELTSALAVARKTAGASSRGAIARGMGRSYGDAAQLRDGVALQVTGLKDFEVDHEEGVVCAQGGATIGELLAALVPAGWMVPVVPGTQHVTVGGAIASDIHGKNHGAAGTLGSHVRSLGLLAATGELLELHPQEELFQATVGGMGLTGVIVWARVGLRAVCSPLLSVDTDRVRDLDDALAVLSAPGGPHRVAWLDLLGSPVGRGIVTRAQHLEEPRRQDAQPARSSVTPRFEVPERWPGGLLRPELVRAYNEFRFRRTARHERGRIQSIGSHMFPLDGLEAWPRLYGKRGFVQYQLVVPYSAENVLLAVIERLRRARVPCFLAVLKDFGPVNQAPLSFPIAGWTLALDLPGGADGLYAALEECDQLVAAVGGRVYLTKDARLRPESVHAMYPRLAEWQAVRDRSDPDGVWCSDLGLRTGLVRT